MKASARQILVLTSTLALLVSCAKIDLSGGKGANTGQQNAQTGGQTGGQAGGQTNGLPPLDGEWELDYEFNGNTFMGNVQLAQQGTALVGEGADQDGKQWTVENGQIQGAQVSFQKKYVGSNSPPINYSGEVKYLQEAEYNGWAMEGEYTSATPNGQTVSGKWVANPLSPLQEVQQQQQQAANPFQQVQQVAQTAPASNSAPAQHHSAKSLGNVKPADISGRYEGSFQFDFKTVKTKMWLRQEGKKLSGDGTDIKDNNSSQRFTIVNGGYNYPDVWLIREYKKGSGATENKTIRFKAKLSSDGRDIAMEGQTHLGGNWSAHLIR